MRIRYATMTTPVGPVAIAWKGEEVVSAHMQEAVDRRTEEIRFDKGVIFNEMSPSFHLT